MNYFGDTNVCCVKSSNFPTTVAFVVGAGVGGIEGSFCFLSETVEQAIRSFPFAVVREYRVQRRRGSAQIFASIDASHPGFGNQTARAVGAVVP